MHRAPGTEASVWGKHAPCQRHQRSQMLPDDKWSQHKEQEIKDQLAYFNPLTRCTGNSKLWLFGAGAARGSLAGAGGAAARGAFARDIWLQETATTHQGSWGNPTVSTAHGQFYWKNWGDKRSSCAVQAARRPLVPAAPAIAVPCGARCPPAPRSSSHR